MKNLKKISTSKRNLVSTIRITGITFGMFALLMACKDKNDEGTTTQENVDSIKTLEIQKVDSTVLLDTLKQADVNVKKP